MCTKAAFGRHAAIIPILAAMLVLSVAAGQPPVAEKIERNLVKESGLYLVFDFYARVVTLKQGGTVLREYPFEIVGDSAVAEKVVNEFEKRDSMAATVETVALLSAKATVPEAELQIIMEETHLTERELQKYLPAEFVIVIEDGPCLRFKTDVEPDHKFKIQIINDYYRRLVAVLSDRKTVKFQMKPEDAMSLYGAARDNPKVIFRR